MGKRRAMCTPGQVYLSKSTLDKMWQRFSDLPERYRPRNGECVPKHQFGWMIKILRKDVALSDVDAKRRMLMHRYSRLLRTLEKAAQEWPTTKSLPTSKPIHKTTATTSTPSLPAALSAVQSAPS